MIAHILALIARSLGHPPMPHQWTQAEVQHGDVIHR